MNLFQGFTKRCRLSWLTNSALVYEPKCGGGMLGGLLMSTAVHAHGAKINYGDLTPYLTYDLIDPYEIYVEGKCCILSFCVLELTMHT